MYNQHYTIHDTIKYMLFQSNYYKSIRHFKPSDLRGTYKSSQYSHLFEPSSFSVV